MGRSPFLLVVLTGVVAAAIARGQQPVQEGPIIVGDRRQRWRGLELRKFEAALDFLGQYRQERLRQPGFQTLEEREGLLRQSLDLTAEASVGHRNLIDLYGDVQLGADYRTLDGNAGSGESNDWSFLNLFDVRAVLLGSARVPTTVYARREESTFDQGFGGRVEQTLSEQGIIASLRSETAPTTVQYFHRTQDFDNAFDQGGSSTTQDTFTGQSNIRISGNQRLDVTYTFDSIEEEQAGVPFDSYDRHDANIVHTLDFGPETRRHELRSSLRLYDQGGRFDQADTRLDEVLVLRHTDRLETRYSATVSEQTRGGQDQQFYRGEATIRHRLFESLISSASAGAQRLSGVDNFTSDDTFATGNLDYTKRVPLGRLNAAVGVSINAQDNSARGTPTLVTNDAAVFNDPLPIVLQRRNVQQGTVVLLPPAGFPPYVEGIDYTLRYFPDRLEIVVPPGSAIQDGQVVLANYTIGPEPANQIDSLSTSTSARYTIEEGRLRGLSVYTIYRTLDQELTAIDPSLFVVEDFRDLLLGAQYVRAGFDLTYEHERRSSNVNPFESDRVVALYSVPLGRGSIISAEYAHDSIDYFQEQNRLEVDRITGRWNQQVTERFGVNARLEYRNERDRLRGDTEAFDQILGLTYRRGQTSIYFSVQNTFLNGPSSERTSQSAQLGIRRDF